MGIARIGRTALLRLTPTVGSELIMSRVPKESIARGVTLETFARPSYKSVSPMRHPLVAHHLNSISSVLRRHFTEALAVDIGILKGAKLPSISGMLTAYCRRRLWSNLI